MKYFYILLALSIISCTKKAPEIKKSNEADILSWKFGSVVAKISGTTITAKFPYGTNLSKLTAVVGISEKASISPDPAKSRNYTHPPLTEIYRDC